MKYNPLSKDIFNKNRKLFSQKIEKNSISIFNSNDVMPTNADGTMPFKQNSDLFWLTGIDQEESVFMMINNNSNIEELLFIKETNEHIAIWEGAKLSKEEAKNSSGIQKVYWIKELEKILKEKIADLDTIFLNKNIHARSSSEVQTRDDRFRDKIKVHFPNMEIKEIAPVMHELRFIKSNLEIELMQHACDITEKGLRRILPCLLYTSPSPRD